MWNCFFLACNLFIPLSIIQKSLNTIVISSSLSTCLSKTILLPIAVVRIQCVNYTGSARILLESTFEVCIISDTFVREQGLFRFRSTNCLSVQGVGGSVNSTHECRLQLSFLFGTSFLINVVIDILPSSLFTYRIKKLQLGAVVNKLKLGTLADPAFIKPVVDIVTVNIIIGAKYFRKLLAQNSKFKVVDSVELMLINFDWVIMGEVGTPMT